MGEGKPLPWQVTCSGSSETIFFDVINVSLTASDLTCMLTKACLARSKFV